jgi:Glycosyl hydrolases family 16
MRGSIVLFVLIGAFLAVTVAGAVPQSGGSTQTTITVAGLDCGTDYRVRVNRVGQASNATVMRIATAPCDDPEPPPPPPPTGCAPAATPGPIAGAGYTVRFADCFDTLNRSVWSNRQWYESAPPVSSQFVMNGELHLQRARANSFQNTSMSTEPLGTKANPKSFQFGYFEARMKWDTVRGNGPAFWLFSTRHMEHGNGPTWNPTNPNPFCQQNGLPRAECLSAEIDIIEGYGNVNYGGTQTDDWFSGTLHRNSSGHYGEANQSRFVQRGTGAEMEQYHVYALRWTPTQLCWFMDGVQQGCVAPFDSTPQPMHLILYNWNTLWESENMPNSTTPDVLDVAVDWVRVWQ